jgi:Ca-activated chloride channel family protein
MSIDKNDPRLTAYALGELEGKELAKFERELSADPEAQAEIRAIRQMGGELQGELAAQPGIRLTPKQQEMLDARVEMVPDIGEFRLLPRVARLFAFVTAACFVFALLIPYLKEQENAPSFSNRYARSGKPPIPQSVEEMERIEREEMRRLAQRDQPPEIEGEPASLKDESREWHEKVKRMQAELNGDAENLTSMKKKGKITIGGSVDAKILNKKREGDEPDTTVVTTDFEVSDQIETANAEDSENMKDDLVSSSVFDSGTPALMGVGESTVGRTGTRTNVSRRHGGISNNRLASRPSPPVNGDPLVTGRYLNVSEKFLKEIGAKFEERNTAEKYEQITENPFETVTEKPLSTFSIDVDTASYANMRRYINGGDLPPADAVRIEEFLNYFDYDYEAPAADSDRPFRVNYEIAECPWQKEHRLVRIGLKGKVIAEAARPACNLVFLLDVSGSMDEPNKLPLLKKSLALLVDKLTERDRVAIVVYAGAAGKVLDSTPASDKKTILAALENLNAGGSTAGGAGIELAYKTAMENFNKEGVNRLILATDGDFNVGVTDRGELEKLVADKAKSGVFLSVLGFGMGNYRDDMCERLADKGNGNCAYIDTLNEAKKVLVNEMGGTLVTIAKDVKIQVEFNPMQVGAYRLIGYENRMLAAEDFNDDKKDAGEIGAGHTVTALYEIVPAGIAKEGEPKVDPLKYQKDRETSDAASEDEILTLKLRYKAPDGDTSTLISFPLTDEGLKMKELSGDFRFASAVAEFGMILRGSKYKGAGDLKLVRELATSGKGADKNGYRAEFLQLLDKAEKLLASRDAGK